jgi:peptidoglycan/xylan/chitin deacetylase (PgdA/CDA1 family)
MERAFLFDPAFSVPAPRATMICMSLWAIAPPAVVAAGTALTAWGAVYPQSQLFGPTIRHTPIAKQFALTFDDGPNPAITPRLLEMLDLYHVRATFFLVGKFVRACPGLAREVAARGHSIGNHTETHPNLFWLNRVRLRQELASCQEAIGEALGQAPRWMRPPYGIRSPFLSSIVREMKFRGVVMWSLIPGDWLAKPADWLIRRMQPVADHIERPAGARPRGGDILVLHDGNHRMLNGDRRRTLAALEYWLPRWKDAGLEFVTIDQISGEGAG